MATVPSLMPKVILKAQHKTHRFFRTHASSKNHEPSTKSPPPPNALPGCPAEIKQAIFLSLPDVRSLTALVLTCSSLYYFFLDSEAFILAKMLQNQIPSDLMPYALRTFKSSEVRPWNRETAQNLTMLYTTGAVSSLSSTKWILRKALVVSEMYDHVQFFANKFASSALSHNPVSGVPETDPSSISPSELSRIQRTLYRFEFYCNLFEFCRKSSGDCSELFACRFRLYAPWENEQLACVCAYLERTVSHFFSDVIETRIQRAARTARFGTDWSNVNPASYLPLGLGLIRRLILAPTDKERKRLLSSQPLNLEDSFDAPLSAEFFTDTRLSQLTQEQQRSLIARPLDADGDSGPSDAWRWAYYRCQPWRWWNTREREKLRAMGYVMWDSARLIDFGILQRQYAGL